MNYANNSKDGKYATLSSPRSHCCDHWKPKCLPFPILSTENFKSGTKKNFEVFDLLDFLAESLSRT